MSYKKNYVEQKIIPVFIRIEIKIELKEFVK